jgi:deoxycytidylate deaminase
MPSDRRLKYVPIGDPFMMVAAEARETLSGDPLYPVGLVVVKDGEVVVRSGNGFSRGSGVVHVCPRVVLECPSGTGYDLCTLHDAPGHAEQMAVKIAAEQGTDIAGGDAYMFGHWWACEPCWNALIAAGIRDLYVIDDAHERFHRDKVYAETLKPSVKTVSLQGADDELAAKLQQTIEDLGCEVTENENAHVRAVCHGSDISIHLPTQDEPVYRITCDDRDQACRQFKNVLRQL